MSVIAWILFGSVAGWISSVLIQEKSGYDLRGNIIWGSIGALMGGYLFNVAEGQSILSVSASGVLIAILMAVIIVRIKQMLTMEDFTE